MPTGLLKEFINTEDHSNLQESGHLRRKDSVIYKISLLK